MHPVPLSSVFQHGEHSKPLADIILQRRMAQATATFLIAAQELVGGGKTLLPAVALTQPLCSTAAVPYSASLESAGIQFNKAAAVAHTIPDGVSVFPLIGRRYYC